jgi:hypothetical protein
MLMVRALHPELFLKALHPELCHRVLRADVQRVPIIPADYLDATRLDRSGEFAHFCAQFLRSVPAGR